MKLVKPLKFSPFDFERGSKATFLSESGLIETALNDVLRTGYTYDPVSDSLSLAGAIIESSSRNYIANSNNFGAWEKFGSPIPSITENYGISPDGTSNAARFLPSSTGTQGIRQYTFYPFSGQPVVFSVFLKAIDSDCTVRLSIFTKSIVFRINVGDYSALGSGAKITPYPDGWFKCEIYELSSSVSSTESAAIIWAINGKSFLMYAGQAETTSASQSYLSSSLIVGSGSSVVNTTGNAISRVSGDLFTEYSSGQTIYIAKTPTGQEYVIDSITDSDNMTVTTSVGSFSGISALPRWDRAADIQLSQSPSLISSNIPEDDADVWDSGDTYTDGQLVMVLGQYHRVYKATALAGNTNKFPPDNPTYWIDTGATNRWRMFDMKVGADLQSSLLDSISVSTAIDDQISAVCLFNVIGESVTVNAYYNGELTYTKTIELTLPTTESGWWAYLWERRRKLKDVAFLDLPQTPASNIDVIVNGGDTAIGKLIIGYAEDLGFAEFGNTSIGITDYSTKEADGFGNYVVQERRFVGMMDVRTVINPGSEIATRDVLADVRATSSAYIVETMNSPIMTLGFFKDFTILFSTPANSYCSLQIEGI